MAFLDRSTPPTPYPVTDITLTAPRRHVLPNGIPLFVIDNPSLDLIHLTIEVGAGALHESQKHVLSFAYLLLKESSPKHNATEMDGLLDFYGATCSVSVTLESIKIKITFPKKNVADILPSIFEFLSTPHYREENLALYKGRRVKDLEYNSQKTNVRCSQLAKNALFGNKMAAGQFSTRENLMAVTIPQMEQIHRETFCAENIRMFATGNFDTELENCISQLFEQIPHGKRAAEIRNLALFEGVSSPVFEQMPDSVQSSIMICRTGPGYCDEQRRPLTILSTLTGGYFSSRLMQRLREKDGFTYGVYSDLTYFGNQSLFSISSDVNVQHTQAAIDACFEELDRLCREPIPDEEVEMVKHYIEGSLLRRVENSVSYLKQYNDWQSYGLDEREFQRMLQQVNDITAEELMDLAKIFFEHNKFTQIIVGNIL